MGSFYHNVSSIRWVKYSETYITTQEKTPYLANTQSLAWDKFVIFGHINNQTLYFYTVHCSDAQIYFLSFGIAGCSKGFYLKQLSLIFQRA